MTSPPELYEAARLRIVDLVRDADPAAPVQACPDWTVKDVLAHLSSVAAGVADGRLTEPPSEAWNAEQVAERRSWSVQDCLAEWEATAARLTTAGARLLGPIAVVDAVSHEHDIRTALGRPGERDSDGVRLAVSAFLHTLRARVRAAGLPALRVVTEVKATVLGDGEPAGTVRASSFELLRAISGRRTPDQVRGLDWDGDPDIWLGVFFLLGPARAPVHE